MEERSIFKRQIFSLVLVVISLITIAIAWGHWEYTLDVCPTSNCGCVLFGVSYGSGSGIGFAGGPVEYCRFVTFAQIPALIASALLLFYHGYRVCIKGKRRAVNAARRANPLLNPRSPNSTSKRNGGLVVLDSEPPNELEPPSLKMNIILLVTSLIISLLLLSAAVIATTGFYSSCREYRNQLVHELAVSGNAAQVVGSRMACTSVFDFLDYLQPDRQDSTQPLQYSRKDRINTGVTLILGKTALFMNFMNWLFISVFNAKNVWTTGGCCRRRTVSYQSN